MGVGGGGGGLGEVECRCRRRVSVGGADLPPQSSDQRVEGDSHTVRSFYTRSTGSSCPRRTDSVGLPSVRERERERERERGERVGE